MSVYGVRIPVGGLAGIVSREDWGYARGDVY
jgi:hypothetical protein